MATVFFILLANLLSPIKSIYDIKAESIDGTIIDFSIYKGKKLLIVNTASKCGFTPQYQDLEKLHEMYGDQIVILGFPSNDFKNQEPGSNSQIAEFCELNYGVKFQMFAKVNVTGDQKCHLYQWLSSKQANGWNDKEPTWNFCKYLVDENGKLVKFLPPSTKPMDKEILDFITGSN